MSDLFRVFVHRALGENGVDLADVPLSQCSGHVSALQENCGSDNDFVRIISSEEIQKHVDTAWW